MFIQQVVGKQPANKSTETSFLSAVILHACRECVIKESIHAQYS